MTREEFIKILDDKGYAYEIKRDKVIVLQGSAHLQALETLPSGIVFNNVGDVYLDSLETLPSGIVFSKWRGNIKGIDSNSLLNLMIKKGLFER
jgi:hypothetical protein